MRYTLRSLLRAPGFTLAVAATFALGIGANTAIFSAVYGVLVRPLPYRDGERLVLIEREQDRSGANRPVPVLFSDPGALETWQAGLPSLESVALYALEVAAHPTADGTELLDTAVVTGSFFPTVSGPMTAGRGFGIDDELNPVAVVSARLASRVFGTPAAALDRQIALSARTYTIVGVADAAFRFPEPDTDVWLPAGFMRTANPRCCGFRMVGRLAADASVARTAGEAHALALAQADAAAGAGGRQAGDSLRATAIGLHDSMVAAARPALRLLLAAAVLTLVVACANVVNLMLARRAARAHEIATRRMLGASRARLAMQAAMESALLAAVGSAVGVGVAIAGVAVLTRLPAAGIPRVEDIRVDVPVLLFAGAITAAAALLTGLLSMSALDGTRPDGRGITASPSARRLRRGLCVAELAVSLTLLVGAGLLGRSFMALVGSDLGVVPDGVVTASMNFGIGGAPRSDEEIVVRTGEVLSALEAVPGVTSAGVGTSLPPNASRLSLTLRRDGESVDYQASGVAATPGYFEALGMRLVGGRAFTTADDLDSPPVMIMSVDTARRFFGDRDPLGRTMTLPVVRDGVQGREEMTLVGVVASVRYSGLDAPPDDAVYRPFRQQPWAAPYLVVRTDGDAQGLTAALRRHVAAVDRSIVLAEVRTLDSILADEAAEPRFRTLLLAAIAALALTMAAVGLYGVVAYSVSQRTKEIGIRMALGARAGDVVRLVVRDGFALAAAGTIAGVVVALVTARSLTGMLYGVEPLDPMSFALASVLLWAVVLLACIVPTRRATRIDPIETLRAE